jgi:hypothetical protein
MTSAPSLPQNDASTGFDKRRVIVFSIFFVLIMLIFLTHMGIRSPYSYGIPLVYHQEPPTIEGYHVNWDAPSNVPVADFLYGSNTTLPKDPRAFSVTALPVPPFWTSVFVGITRSYMLANSIANIVALLLLFLVFMNFAAQLGISYKAIAVAGVGILLLPFFAHYIGQPMQYITGTAINFLILLAIMSLSHNDYKNPAGLGLLTGIFLLSYDWYVFVVAAVLYFIFFYRFKKKVHYLYFFLALFAPFVIWSVFIQIIRPAGVSNLSYSSFLKPVVKGWLEYIKHPRKEFSLPFQASQIGLIISFRQIIALIYWPLILFTGYYLIKFRDELKESKLFKLVFLLLGVFLAEQVFTAVFDWENNTRRAIPVIFVFAFAFTYVVAKTIDYKKVKYVIVILLIVSFALTFADVFIKDPSFQANQYGESIRGGPKEVMKWYQVRLDRKSMSDLPRDKKLQFFKVQKVRFSSLNLGSFVFSQIFLFLVLLALFYFLYKAELLPDYSMWIFGAFFVASIFFRFI